MTLSTGEAHVVARSRHAAASRTAPASRLSTSPLPSAGEMLEETSPRGPALNGEASLETSRIAVYRGQPATGGIPQRSEVASSGVPAGSAPVVPPRPPARADPAVTGTSTPLGVVRERWVVAVVTMLLTAGATVAAGMLMPATYDATTTVSLASTSGASSLASTGLGTDAATEAVQARSISLAETVAALLDDGRTGQDLLSALVVTTPMEANVLRFTFSSGSAQDAADVANLYARTYLAERKQIYEAVVAGLAAELTEKIEALDPEADGPLVDRLVQERSSLPSVLYPGRLSNEATPGTASTLPGRAAFGAAGLAGGLIVGVLAALVADRVDPRVLNRRRLEEIVGADTVPVQPHHLDEAPYRLLVLLRSATGEAVVSRVAVVSPQGRYADLSVDRLRARLEAEAVRPNGLSRGLPIYWVDARGTGSRARQLELASAADATVLVVARSDRRRSVADLVEALDVVRGDGVVVCLFVGTRRRGAV